MTLAFVVATTHGPRYLNVLSGENTGTLLFVAVALHNVPIGAVVAATTIAASGSRWKAVVAAAIVGLTFPLSGLLAFAAGDRLSSPSVTAVTFALTAGTYEDPPPCFP